MNLFKLYAKLVVSIINMYNINIDTLMTVNNIMNAVSCLGNI